MRWIALFITIPATLFAVLFAVSNTARVDVGFFPLEHTWNLPLYAVALGLMGAGFFLGALFVWLHGRRTFFRYWQESRRARELEREVEGLKHRAENEDVKMIGNGT